MHQIIITDNFFSTSMLTGIDGIRLLEGVCIEFYLVSPNTVFSWLHQDDTEVISAIENVEVAKDLSDLLGIRLGANKIPVKLTLENSIIIVQSSDIELPVEARTLLDETKMYFWEVSLVPWQ